MKKKKATALYWRSIKRSPKWGDEYLVVYVLDDGGYPLTTMMDFDAKEKKWTDPKGVPDADMTDKILLWSPLPKAPRGIPKKLWQPDPVFNSPMSRFHKFIMQTVNMDELTDIS